MANGVHAGHGAGAMGSTGAPVGAPAGGMEALQGDPAFHMLLSESAEALGATEGELMQAMHAAEALVAGRDDLTEEQKLATMMDYVTGQFGASDLTNDEMMQLMELCRMCLDAWTAEAAAEEGYEIVQTDRSFVDPIAGVVDMIGRPTTGRPEPEALSAPRMGPLRPVETGDDPEEEDT
ncbi:hypothetical protein ACTZWW_20625 [Salinarimonas sp. NSM]|uniref:hypothetical protein n=1 Tax=Salinarimonas sp. NSM TaxID=3458003 RepID=UPI00403663CF